MCFLFVSVRTRRYVLEEPGFHRLPIIFCARIFTRHKNSALAFYSATRHFTRQLGILLSYWHFTWHKTWQLAFLPGN